MFKKGQSGNPAGRKVGSKNKATEVLRRKISKIVGDYMKGDQFDSDMKELSASERVNAIIKMTSFILPKLQSVETDKPEYETEIQVHITRELITGPMTNPIKKIHI